MNDAPSKAAPRIGIVVGSGGMKCAAALGLWKVLRREGIEVDMAVGCSGGSIYTSLMALGSTVEESIEHNVRMWTDIFPRRSGRSLLGAVFPRFFSTEQFGLIDDSRLNEVLRFVFGDRQFTDTRFPLTVVATDLETGQKVLIEEGSIFNAVRASVAIPFALSPWRVGGRLLVDGGASDPLPVDVAIREGCEIILAMGFESPTVEVGSLMSLALQTSATTVNHLLKSTYAFYSVAHHAEIIPMMPTFDQRIGLNDVHLMPYIIEQGEKAAERELPYIKRLLGRALAGSTLS